MSISYVGSSSSSTNGATSLSVPDPGYSVGFLAVIAVGFEGQAAGSGPWVLPHQPGDPSTVVGEATDWKQILYQAPSATGNGLEVWAAVIIGAGGGSVTVRFTGSYAAAATQVCYSGQYGTHILDGAVRAFAKRQWTGDDPEAPSVFAYEQELLLACGATQLQSPGYGDPTPVGWDTKVDKARANTFGNVETVIAGKSVTIEGNTGVIPWNANSSSGSDKGATATLAVRPAETVAAATSPLIALEYAAAT